MYDYVSKNMEERSGLGLLYLSESSQKNPHFLPLILAWF